MREFATGATRGSNTNKLDYRGFLSSRALKQFAEYMHSHRLQPDGNLRASDNWKLGIPIDAYVESLVRHIFEFMEAIEEKDYDLADKIAPAVFFNIQGFMHERSKLKDKE